MGEIKTEELQSVTFPNLMPNKDTPEASNIGLLLDVKMELSVVLGKTKKTVKEILEMGEGTIIELDSLAGEPCKVYIGDKLIAKGEVVVVDECFALRVVEICDPKDRLTASED